LTALCLSKSSLKLEDDEKCRSAKIPDEPWLSINNCGFEDQKVKLLGFVPDPKRMPPTAGLGFWVDIYYVALESFHTTSGRMVVKWSGLPFVNYAQEYDKEFEAGKCYSDRQYAYLKEAPAGVYDSTIKLFDDFGTTVACNSMKVVVRKAVRN